MNFKQQESESKIFGDIGIGIGIEKNWHRPITILNTL